MSKKRARSKSSSRISKGIFLVGLAVVICTQLWWPGIAIVALVSLWTRQVLDRNYKDANVSILIALAILISLTSNVGWHFIIAVVLAVKGVSMIVGVQHRPLKDGPIDAEVEIVGSSDS